MKSLVVELSFVNKASMMAIQRTLYEQKMNKKTAFNLESITKHLPPSASSNKAAPVDQWNPDFCGDIDLLIKRNGEWIYQQTPITRPAMVNLFARVLWYEDGRYYLKTPVEKIGIQVEEAPFYVTQMLFDENEEGRAIIRFVTLTGDDITLDQTHPIRLKVDPLTSEPTPLVMVRFGMEAIISRPVFYELVEHAHVQRIDNQDQLVVESAGYTFILGSVS